MCIGRCERDASGLLRHVQSYDEHAPVAAAAADDGQGHLLSMHAVSLTAALLTARRLYILSRRIKSSLSRRRGVPLGGVDAA